MVKLLTSDSDRGSARSILGATLYTQLQFCGIATQLVSRLVPGTAQNAVERQLEMRAQLVSSNMIQARSTPALPRLKCSDAADAAADEPVIEEEAS